MFEDLELKNCPEQFALNCRNYQINCYKCKGNDTSAYLLYKPINNSIGIHPSINIQKSKVQSYSSKGRQKERLLVKNISRLKATVASGIVNGNGDAYISLNNIGKVQVEIKTRFTNINNIKPTLKEFREGLTQNIQLFVIHNHKRNKNYFYLDYILFVELWKTFVLKSWRINTLPFLGANWEKELGLEPPSKIFEFTPYFNSMTTWFNLVDEFKFKWSNFGNKFYETSRLFILKNKVGVYIAMNEDTFNDLIDLYQDLTK